MDNVLNIKRHVTLSEIKGYWYTQSSFEIHLFNELYCVTGRNDQYKWKLL
jgi:hypothetical protein